MTSEQFLKLLTSVHTWKRRQERRAPYKPLLLLLALGRLRQGCPRLRLYRDIESELRKLLIGFGPPRKAYHPEQPFQRLPNDGLWELHGLSPTHLDASGQLRARSARDSELKGGFPAEIQAFLIAHPFELRQAVQYLLNDNFPESIHADLLEAVNLGEILLPAAKREENALLSTRSRDPRFCPNVILAYRRQCAICGYDIRLQDQLMGLEAAHIFWHASGGPDEVPNGLALCTVHRKAFDRGGIGLGDNLELMVSSVLQGRSEAWEIWFGRFAGRSIRQPHQFRDLPNLKYLQWHRSQVFRGLE